MGTTAAGVLFCVVLVGLANDRKDAVVVWLPNDGTEADVIFWLLPNDGTDVVVFVWLPNSGTEADVV